MTTIGATTEQEEAWSRTPGMYPRLTYADEVAALEYLTRVFQFTERREARMGGDDDEGMLASTPRGGGPTSPRRSPCSPAENGTSCCSSPGRACRTSRSPPRSTSRSAPCGQGCTGRERACANSSPPVRNNT